MWSEKLASLIGHYLFLRGTFNGQYLVIDAEMGVLGRDILNHVRVLLDGPALTWDESAAAAKTP